MGQIRCRRLWPAIFFVLLPAFCNAGRSGGETPLRAPGVHSKGRIYAWKSKGGLAYEFFVPKAYHDKQGANLLFILHGSNLDRRWGFANHPAGKFRPEDIIVCPDGTSPNGSGGFNFRGTDRDLNRLHQLQLELTHLFNVRATFLYGHSQGAFFAFLYAGAFPDQVQGVLAQAGGVWIGTQAGAKQRHQAVAIMHGTADPVVPFSMSLESLKFYRQNDFEKVHLRALRDWNHWPSASQAAQQLAWCEGMTTDRPQRATAAFNFLAGVQKGRDPAAFHAVAVRLSTLAALSAGVQARAKKAAAAMEALARRHVELIEKSLGSRHKSVKLQAKEWVGHLPLFLLEFDGVPPCDRLREKWASVLKKQRESAVRAAGVYDRKRSKDVPEAFVAGVDLVARSFLVPGAVSGSLLETLSAWRKDARPLKISHSQVKYYDKVIPVFLAAREQGKAAFESVQ